MASSSNEIAVQLFNDLERIQDAIRRYVSHEPLDLKSPGEIQSDLLAIAGEMHRHRKSIGNDSCLLCGHDLRHAIHQREIT